MYAIDCQVAYNQAANEIVHLSDAAHHIYVARSHMSATEDEHSNIQDAIAKIDDDVMPYINGVRDELRLACRKWEGRA